jgi:flagellar FliJ protein
VQLRTYESSYHAQLAGKLRHAVFVETLRGHHRFMQNISHAIRQQEVEVARRQTAVETIRRVWQEVERRRQGFRVMADKAAQVARRVEERRSQKLSDEASSRQVARNHFGQ